MAEGGITYLRYGFAGLMMVAISGLAALVCALPMGLPEAIAPGPAIALAQVCFLTARCHVKLPAPLVFLLGLALDFAAGTPFGFWAFMLLGGYAVTLSQRRWLITQAFGVAWLGFALTALAFFTGAWAVSSVLAGEIPQLGPIGVNTALAVALYPIVACFCSLGVMVAALTPGRRGVLDHGR